MWILGIVGCTHAPPAAPEAEVGVHVAWAGTAEVEGHLATPGATVPVELELRVDRVGDVRRLVVRSWDDDPADASTETYWLGPAAAVRDADGAVTALSPQDAVGVQALMDGLDPAQQPLDRAFPHPTYGDVVDRAHPVAGRLEVVHHEADLRWTASLAPIPAEGVPLGEPPAATWVAPAPPRLERIADGVWAAVVPACDTASLVVDTADGLFVADTGLTVSAGEAIVDLLHAELPDRPIRHVAVSHHHPHYTGGLRAFFAEGATLHAPEGQAAFAAEVAARRFTSPPDRYAAHGRAPSVEVFAGRTAVAGEVVLVDIGARSQHTDEYVLVAVPRLGLLYEGDLGYWVDEAGVLRAGRRAAGLAEAIAAEGLDVRQIVQGWPATPWVGAVDRARFDAAVQARGAP